MRCDLMRPACGSCIARSLDCEYTSEASVPSTVSRHSSASAYPRTNRHSLANCLEEPCRTPSVIFDSDDGMTSASRSVISDGYLTGSGISSQSHSPETMTTFNPSKMGLSDRRRRELLGGATHNAKFNVIAEHTARFTLRSVRSWPRLLAMHGTMHLPPMMHRLQFTEGTPTALSNCLTLLHMWHTMDRGNEQLVHDTVLAEIKRLIGSVSMCCLLESEISTDVQSSVFIHLTIYLPTVNLSSCS